MWGAAAALFALQSLDVLGRSKNKKSCVLLVFSFFFGGVVKKRFGMVSRSSTLSAGCAESETPRNIFFRASSHKVGVVACWSNYCKTMKKNSCRNMHILAKRGMRRDVANEFQIITECEKM